MMKALILAFFAMVPTSHAAEEYTGSTFNEVVTGLQKDPYTGELPDDGLSLTLLMKAGQRSMYLPDDLIPWRERFNHANGICMFGTWSIFDKSPYTGLLASGTKGLLVSRISSAGYVLNPKKPRAFGFAVKIFPTMNPDERVKTVNAVFQDSVSGITRPHALDTIYLNRPTLGEYQTYAKWFLKLLSLVDETPHIRQIYPLSEYGNPSIVKEPFEMRIVADPYITRVDAMDYREELNLRNYPGHTLRYSIDARESDEAGVYWKEIGEIRFVADAVSEACDHEVHFQHPVHQAGKN